jgi:spore coat protein H
MRRSSVRDLIFTAYLCRAVQGRITGYFLVLLSQLITAVACTVTDEEQLGGVFTDDAIEVAKLPWPTEFLKLPSCDGSFGDFTEPKLPEPEGDILLIPSARLQPTDVEEHILIEVHLQNTGDLDTYAFGELTVDAGPDAEVLSAAAVESGTGAVSVRFDTPGAHQLTVSFKDESGERSGSIEIIAYAPQLPIYEMTIAESDFERLLDNPYEKITVPAGLTVDGQAFGTRVRIHGGASRDYPKKSFRFDLDEGLTLPDGRDHIILRAEWNDKSLLRNYLAFEIVRNGTWLSAPSVEPVHFRVNQQYYGLMWRVERIDGDFLRTRGMNNISGSMYEADPASLECASPGADMTPLVDMDEYRCVYSQQKGDEDYGDLTDFIENTLTLSPWDFQAVINDVVRVNDILVYFAVMAAIQNQDHIKKNYYLFRDPELEDDRWIIFPWDLDLTLGHLWTYEADTLDETIFTDMPLDFGVCPGYCNVLFSRLLEINPYRDRLFEMADRIAATVLTPEFVDERIDNLLCRAKPDILADSKKRATNEEFPGRVEELRRFIDERQSFILNGNP